MISIDPSSDLLSSHDLKFSDADHLNHINNPLPNFSIRDYVNGIRSKDISCNWPFSSTSLQLCLKLKVKNLLPPFESIDSIRNNSSLARCSLKNRLTDEKLIPNSDGQLKNDRLKSNGKIAFEAINPKSSASTEKDKPQKPGKASSIRSIIKKSRSVTKVISGVENGSLNSETMTSKVCPVCKNFSSSSNTTLNAHIDQCLTGEGTMKWTENPEVNVVVKHRVKPRKMRLMRDIYKTAPHCTIEELERRNGTSWATTSNFPAQEIQFQNEEVEEKEEEEEEPKRTSINPEVAGNEGDVYIDTDGTKIRILSVPNTASSVNHGGRKLPKEVRSKIIMSKKKLKDTFKKKHQHRYLKHSSNANKLCLPKPKAHSGQEDDVAMKVADLGIIRPPWACSKRTGLSKKFSGENQKVELQRRETKELVGESKKSTYARYRWGTPQSSLDGNPDSSENWQKMRISLSLLKQPPDSLAEFRKKGTHMHDDDNDEKKDGSLDAYPSPHSDDADIRSKGSKFSSLAKSLSLPAAKFNLKKRFSAVEKSSVHFTENSVDMQSPDSLKEHCGIDEHPVGRLENSNGESSVELETVKQDDLHVVESVRNETLLSSVVPAPSFMGLSTSFDPDFSKQECDELYHDQTCSTNRAFDDVEIHESYRQEVDPIPIPGPPGSFLPASPGGEMVSEEEIQPVTILSREIQTHHHLDHTIDQDSMSNSPVSTVSNSRSTSVQDDTCKKPFFSGDTSLFREKGSSVNSFKNDHQPCCCSRKDVILNYQDSYILRKQQSELASYPTHKKFPISNECDSSAGSSSKPVLRLMGKNLTVVKTDGDEFRPPQSSQQHPVLFSQHQNGFQSQHFNIHPPNMRTPVDPMPIHRCFMRSVAGYGHSGPYREPSMPQTRSHHGRNDFNFQTSNGRNVYTAASSSKPVNEIIIIDDSPESEPDNSTRNDFLKRNERQMDQSYAMYPSYAAAGSFQSSSGNEDFGSWNIRSPSMFHLRSSTSYYPPNYL